MRLDGKVITPVARITTSKGEILVALFEDEVPNTVANFITLAESGFYKDTAFHRILLGFMAQGGCPNSKPGAKGRAGTGGPGYRFPDEIKPATNKHSGRGILSMANSGKDTNGSQFFLCFKATPHLDRKHTVFGKVVKGWDVLETLESLAGAGEKPSETVRFDIEIVAKRDHKYEVKGKLPEKTPPVL
ncbi:MAG: peptidylprolyl isomerase, partial [Lentisphaeria bacterium]|nr:peptidylprolyl isomerase [Lentisphaeria bacterium]